MSTLAPACGAPVWRRWWVAAFGLAAAWPVLALDPSPAPSAVRVPAVDAAPAAVVAAGWPSMRWIRPGDFFPVLGWRLPVDLSASELPVDRLIAGIPADRYNCHFYTKAYVEWRGGSSDLGRRLRAPRDDLVTEDYLRARGFRPAGPEGAKEGDLLLAVRDVAGSARSVTHSAVIVAVDARGEPLRIRQKFNPECPVVDVDAAEFRMLYAGMHPWRVEVWRAPGADLALAAPRAMR